MIVGFSAGLSISTVSSQEPFYAGKNIRIIVGFTPGGGYDTYARLIARHLGKYIPGNPAATVENMPGAGSLILANHIYKVAKPDGLTVGHFIGGSFSATASWQTEAKQLIRAVIQVHGPTVRPFVLSPGTPKERVQLLRKGFADTLKDPELLAEAKKANLEINALDGAELERRIKDIFALNPSLVEKLKGILK